VLTGVLLHVLESPRPVDLSAHAGRLDFIVKHMNNFASVRLDHVDYACAAKQAGVERLSA